MTDTTYTPPPITGYRTLTQAEVDLMNKIKEHGLALDALVRLVRHHLTEQHRQADPLEEGRINAAEPQRWAAIGRTHFQEGLMALTRAVAQPGSF